MSSEENFSTAYGEEAEEEDYSTSALEAGVTAALRSKFYFSSNEKRLGIMFLLVGLFCIAELVTGAITRSLALLSDALHMLSDAMAILIGLFAARMAQRQTRGAQTYGWQRAELIGALVNGVFLISACLFIIFEAIERMSLESDQLVREPWIVLGVGCAGLVINCIGLLLFCSCTTDSSDGSHSHGHSHAHSHGHSHSHDRGNNDSRCSANMRGVFLHVLADALGSVVVIIVALLNLFISNKNGENAWLFYFDPVCSLLLAVFIICSAVPLVKQTMHIFMQSVPRSIDIDNLRQKIASVPNVSYVHALHVWQMTSLRLVGSVHIVYDRHCLKSELEQLNVDIKRVFHDENVHESAVQLERERKSLKFEDKTKHHCADKTRCCEKTVEHSRFS